MRTTSPTLKNTCATMIAAVVPAKGRISRKASPTTMVGRMNGTVMIASRVRRAGISSR